MLLENLLHLIPYQRLTVNRLTTVNPLSIVDQVFKPANVYSSRVVIIDSGYGIDGYAKMNMNKKRLRKVHGRLNASWKISSLAVNGQSILVIDGYLLNLLVINRLIPRND